MANRYAVATGNWSSLATWDGGASLPGAGDSVRPNGYTVTIDQNITVTELIGNASSPAVAGGTFVLQSGRTITGNVVMATGGGSLMSLTGTGSSRTIIGNVSSSVSGLGIYVASNSDGLVIVGNVTSTGNGNCINGYDRLYLTITGNVSSTSTGRAIEDQTGAGTASISITGDVTTSGAAAAIYCNTAGTISITGTVTAATTYAVYSGQALVIHNGNQIDGTTGHRAIHTTRLWISSSVQTQYQIRTNNSGVVGALRSLYTGGVNLGQPAAANVRSGTTYGAASEYTGTLAVPSPTLVAIGVATDNTVGSYAPSGGLDAAGVRSAIGLASANLDTQLTAIKNSADGALKPTTAGRTLNVSAAHAALSELDSDARVKLAASQPDYAPATTAALAAVDAKIGTPETSLSAMVANVPTATEFEARTIAAASYRQNISLRGSGMTEAKAFDLLLAASAGITSQPSGTTEKFKFLDGNDAFTTTFDTNGNRTGVSLA